jgi:hypothetical protein
VGVNGVNEQLSGLADRFAYVRTGKVVVVDAMFATVTVGETVIRASYVRQSEPVPGDVVAVVRQGASWMILGTSSVSGGNAVQNPSFEEFTGGQVPTGWTLNNVSGATTATTIYDPEQAVDGERVLDVFPNGGAAATSLVYSLAIAVASGQVWELSCHVTGNYPGTTNENTTDVSLRALWFANATDLYPTTSAADSTVASVTNILQGETMQVMRGQVTVPVGGVFMRVALRSACLAGAGARYDFVTARRVS